MTAETNGDTGCLPALLVLVIFLVAGTLGALWGVVYVVTSAITAAMGGA